MTDELSARACRMAFGFAIATFVAGCVALGVLFFSGSETLNRVDGVLSSHQKQDRVRDDEVLRQTISSLARSPSTLQAFEALDAGYRAHIPEHLRDMYVALNPHQGEDLSLLTDPRDGSQYTEAHARHHAWLRDIAHINGFAELALVRKDGHVIYTVHKGRSFAHRLSEGDDDRSLRENARAVRLALEKSSPVVALSEEHASLLGERQSHAASALLDTEGQPVGALVVTRTAPSLAGAKHDHLSAMTQDWKRRGVTVLAIFGLSGAILLTLLLVMFTRRRSAQSRPALPLVPVERPRQEVDSVATGSHRSGTRPALNAGASDGATRPNVAGHG